MGGAWRFPLSDLDLGMSLGRPRKFTRLDLLAGLIVLSLEKSIPKQVLGSNGWDFMERPLSKSSIHMTLLPNRGCALNGRLML
ncbi:MAG: hypothetical protein CV089_19685 [Nitrospira sp. WS110]|nr:hypothetical protein [Nitrospira sp. WS110]